MLRTMLTKFDFVPSIYWAYIFYGLKFSQTSCKFCWYKQTVVLFHSITVNINS